MKKVLSMFVLALFLMTSAVQAQTTIKVEAMEDFSTLTPSASFSVKTIEFGYLPGGTVLQQGAIVSGLVSKVQHARRLKQSGYFEFIPSSVSYDSKTTIIEQPTSVAKVVSYQPLDPKQIVGTVAKSAAGYAIKGATQGISFIQGIVQAQNGDRIMSGLTKVYKDSPLSYIDEGSEFDVKIGDQLVLIVKEIENQD